MAVHKELRTDPLALQRAAVRYSSWLPSELEEAQMQQGSSNDPGMLASSRFIRLHDYVDTELGQALGARAAKILAGARLAIWEKISPMSYHVGLVRVSLGTEPMMDILFDTSDCDRHLQPKAFVAFHAQVPWLLKRWNERGMHPVDLGKLVRAW